MNTGKIASRYAKALLLHSEELHCSPTVYEDSKIIVTLFAQSKELNSFIQNPVVSYRTKKELIARLLSFSKNSILATFLSLMVRNERGANIHRAMLVFGKLYRERYSIADVRVITSAAVNQIYLDRIGSLISDRFCKKPEITHSMNQELIGGFTLFVDDLYLDSSVSGQLKRMRQRLGVS